MKIQPHFAPKPIRLEGADADQQQESMFDICGHFDFPVRNLVFRSCTHHRAQV